MNSLVYVSNWAKALIEKYYGACGLKDSIFRLIEVLPDRLNLKLGKSRDFWLRELDDPASKIHALNLLDGAIEHSINVAKHLSEKTGVEFCKHLRDSIERDWIGSWLTGYIRSMLSTYYNLGV